MLTINTCGTAPSIYYNPNQEIERTPKYNQDSLKVNIKTYSGGPYIMTVLTYVFYSGQATQNNPLKFIMVLQKDIKGQELSTVPQNYCVICTLLLAGYPKVFDQKTREFMTEINHNYKLVTRYLISHLFISKAIQSQKRYPLQYLYNPVMIRSMISFCRNNDIIGHFNNLSLFGTN